MVLFPWRGNRASLPKSGSFCLGRQLFCIRRECCLLARFVDIAAQANAGVQGHSGRAEKAQIRRSDPQQTTGPDWNIFRAWQTLVPPPLFSPPQSDRLQLIHEAFGLEWLTIGWMTVEAVVSIGAGGQPEALCWSPLASKAIIELAPSTGQAPQRRLGICIIPAMPGNTGST
jgi:hypothetical protein